MGSHSALRSPSFATAPGTGSGAHEGGLFGVSGIYSFYTLHISDRRSCKTVTINLKPILAAVSWNSWFTSRDLRLEKAVG